VSRLSAVPAQHTTAAVYIVMVTTQTVSHSEPRSSPGAQVAHLSYATPGTCCGSVARFGPARHELGYAQAVSDSLRIERGWIYVNGTRRDDGTIELGTGGEMRFSPFEAMSQRQEARITWRDILTASVQRLAFWRR
jgi:hypothetical protein